LAIYSSRHLTFAPSSSLEERALPIACTPKTPLFPRLPPISFLLQSYYRYRALAIKEAEVGTSAGKATHSVTPYFDGTLAENSEKVRGSGILGNREMDDCLEGISAS
jgi:hypothetical protein